MLAVELLYFVFIVLISVFCIPRNTRFLSWKSVGFVYKPFSPCSEVTMWFLSLSVVIWWIIFIVCMLSHAWICGKKETWLWWVTLFWFILCKVFIDNFCTYDHQGDWPIILSLSLPGWVFIWFWYQDNSSFKMNVEMFFCPFLLYRIIWGVSVLVFEGLVKLYVNPSGLRLFILGRF